MTATAIDTLRTFGSHGAPAARPPEVLREDRQMDRACQIGVPMMDTIVRQWFEWRDAADAAPEWTVFSPLRHPALLPHIMLYERIEGRYRCAIVGEGASAHLPIKIAGQFIDEAMPPANRDDVTSRLDEALESGLPNFVEKTMAWQIGFDLTSYRALQLPFSARAGGRPRVLSVMDFRVEKQPKELRL